MFQISHMKQTEVDSVTEHFLHVGLMESCVHQSSRDGNEISFIWSAGDNLLFT